MTIKTDRLILRPFTFEDAKAVASLCHNKKLTEMTLSLPYPYTEEMAINWINQHAKWRDSKERFEWAITVKDTKELIGAIGLSHHLVFHHGELGYWIGEPYWNQGYASEAAVAIIKWAFTKMKFHRIFARHFQFNQASKRVMEKAGLVFEGRQIDHVFKDGKYHTLEVCSIINGS